MFFWKWQLVFCKTKYLIFMSCQCKINYSVSSYLFLMSINIFYLYLRSLLESKSKHFSLVCVQLKHSFKDFMGNFNIYS